MSEFQQAFASDHHLFFPSHLVCLELLASLAGPGSGSVLQLGCGSGEYVAALSRQGHPAWGVELDQRLHMQSHILHPNLSERLLQGDMLEVFDLVRGPFSLVFSLAPGLASLDHTDQVTDVLAQMLDLCLPEGALLIELPNFDHLLAQAMLTLQHHSGTAGGPLADPARPEYVELIVGAPQAASPQLGSISSELLRLYLPPLSAFRADGEMLELERVYEATPAEWSSTPPPSKFQLSMIHRGPLGESVHSQELLCLTRERTERCLQDALARTHNQGRQIAWYGGFDQSAWSPSAGTSIVVLR